MKRIVMMAKGFLNDADKGIIRQTDRFSPYERIFLWLQKPNLLKNLHILIIADIFVMRPNTFLLLNTHGRY
ncbi:MAG: hypothetical protein HY754_11820 [Nitrospirae bacterium]|nr:hypothetical protein [Nitrospirota bacterium]